MRINSLCAILFFAATLALPGVSAARTTAEPATEAASATKTVRVATISRTAVKEAVQAETLRIRQARPGRLWCVPFARAVSGIEIRGDAATWWKKAGAEYPKGRVPVSGSVLNFRATGSMPRGHVAVVSEILSPREILVDQANWVKNRVTLDTVVIDVSARNDWSAVRVANQSNSFGRVYPTYGFIYRPADSNT
jgi:surface antigen